MSYVHVVLALLSLAREFIRYLHARAEDPLDETARALALKEAFTQARKNRSSKELEGALKKYL